MPDSPLRGLPAVHVVLADPRLAAFPRPAALAAARAALADARAKLKADPAATPTPDAIAGATLDRLTIRPVGLRPVLNATGVVLHTNLGRAPVSEAAALAAYHAARGYSDLELDLATGKRASRQRLVRAAIARLTGGEAGTAVNNCAAATVLTLRALAAGKEVIVSRGQLVEIGGSYRLPEILAASGATLREVGTTNITRASDYELALSANTGMILRVHTSNYRVEGFTRSVTLPDLARIGKAAGVPVVDDAGSGKAFAHPALSGDPDVRASLAAGADLVLFSGDKLLGGPQAGLIGGKKALVDRIERDPLARAFRPSKMTLAALAVTLDAHLSGAPNPVADALRLTPADLRPRCDALAARLARAPCLTIEVRASTGYAGGGSAPGSELASVAVTITMNGVGETDLARRLRLGEPAVVARVRAGRVWLDLRVVPPDADDALAAAVEAAT